MDILDIYFNKTYFCGNFSKHILSVFCYTFSKLNEICGERNENTFITTS